MMMRSRALVSRHLLSLSASCSQTASLQAAVLDATADVSADGSSGRPQAAAAGHRAYHSSPATAVAFSQHAQDGQRSNSDALRRAAQMAMEDPLSRLMASRGMPLGLSLNAVPPSAPGGSDSSAGPSSGGSSSSSSSSSGTPAAYPMEALEEIMQTTQGGAATTAEAAGGQDSWGTTRESAAQIARRIAESNAGSETTFDEELEAAAKEADRLATLAGQEPDDLVLSADEMKYKTLEQMSKDIKELDEVFEVLASVPWLDEDDVEEKALKGMAQLTLLGTLEEVGFGITDQVRRIWGGERDHDLVLEGKSAKDQAALISVLFHTKLIEDKHGLPAGMTVHMGKKAAPGGAGAGDQPPRGEITI